MLPLVLSVLFVPSGLSSPLETNVIHHPNYTECITTSREAVSLSGLVSERETIYQEALYSPNNKNSAQLRLSPINTDFWEMIEIVHGDIIEIQENSTILYFSIKFKDISLKYALSNERIEEYQYSNDNYEWGHFVVYKTEGEVKIDRFFRNWEVMPNLELLPESIVALDSINPIRVQKFNLQKLGLKKNKNKVADFDYSKTYSHNTSSHYSKIQFMCEKCKFSLKAYNRGYLVREKNFTLKYSNRVVVINFERSYRVKRFFTPVITSPVFGLGIYGIQHLLDKLKTTPDEDVTKDQGGGGDWITPHSIHIEIKEGTVYIMKALDMDTMERNIIGIGTVASKPRCVPVFSDIIIVDNLVISLNSSNLYLFAFMLSLFIVIVIVQIFYFYFRNRKSTYLRIPL